MGVTSMILVAVGLEGLDARGGEEEGRLGPRPWSQRPRVPLTACRTRRPEEDRRRC